MRRQGRQGWGSAAPTSSHRGSSTPSSATAGSAGPGSARSSHVSPTCPPTPRPPRPGAHRGGKEEVAACRGCGSGGHTSTGREGEGGGRHAPAGPAADHHNAAFLRRRPSRPLRPSPASSPGSPSPSRPCGFLWWIERIGKEADGRRSVRGDKSLREDSKKERNGGEGGRDERAA